MENHHDKKRQPLRKPRAQNGRSASSAQSGRASAIFDAVSRAAEDHLATATETMGEYVDEGRSQVDKLSRRLESKIVSHPWRTLIGAVGLGVLAGLLIRRR